MKNIAFSKLCASGNDFIVIDNREKILHDNIKDIAIKLCKRKYSIGADGLMLVEKSDKADFKMRIINPDGSEVDMCGNGARCIALYAYKNKIALNKMTFETFAGLIEAEVTKDNLVKLKMSAPHSLSLDKEWNFINTGVPHVVIFVDDIDKIDVKTIGNSIRYHKKFAPAGTNVNFVKIKDDKHIRVRTYERGVEDETLACGTGSVASAIISGIKFGMKSPVSVITQGGSALNIYFKIDKNKSVSDVCLEGDAEIIYEGSLHKLSIKN